MDLDADEHALFDMLRAEAVPPPLATAIVLKLLDHPDADPALAITPVSLRTFMAGKLLSRRSEEHTSELQSLMRISYAVFCLKKKKTLNKQHNNSLRLIT